MGGTRALERTAQARPMLLVQWPGRGRARACSALLSWHGDRRRDAFSRSEAMPEAHAHYVNRAGWLRAAVLGANDGILSTASLILGAREAGADPCDAHDKRHGLGRRTSPRRTASESRSGAAAEPTSPIASHGSPRQRRFTASPWTVASVHREFRRSVALCPGRPRQTFQDRDISQ